MPVSGKCPQCGNEPYTRPGPCSVCNHAERFPLSLVTADGSIVLNRINLELKMNAAWARKPFSDEARFWDPSWQFTLKPIDKDWMVIPNMSAANKTLLDGRTVEMDTVLSDGVVLGVGNAEKGVVKCIMTVKLSA